MSPSSLRTPDTALTSTSLRTNAAVFGIDTSFKAMPASKGMKFLTELINIFINVAVDWGAEINPACTALSQLNKKEIANVPQARVPANLITTAPTTQSNKLLVLPKAHNECTKALALPFPGSLTRCQTCNCERSIHFPRRTGPTAS